MYEKVCIEKERRVFKKISATRVSSAEPNSMHDIQVILLSLFRRSKITPNVFTKSKFGTLSGICWIISQRSFFDTFSETSGEITRTSILFGWGFVVANNFNSKIIIHSLMNYLPPRIIWGMEEWNMFIKVHYRSPTGHIFISFNKVENLIDPFLTTSTTISLQIPL